MTYKAQFLARQNQKKQTLVDERIQRKHELREALKVAISKEHRFGIREDCRQDLDAEWDRVIDLMEALVRE